MIERNFKNNLIWEEPGENLLLVEARETEFDQEQIENVYSLGFSGGLAGESEVLFVDAGFLLGGQTTNTIFGDVSTLQLLVPGTEPYTIFRDGTQIDSNVSESEFPYVDTFASSGSRDYRVEDATGSVEEITLFISS